MIQYHQHIQPAGEYWFSSMSVITGCAVAPTLRLVLTAWLVAGKSQISTLSPTESTALDRSLKLCHMWLRRRTIGSLQVCQIWCKSVHGGLCGNAWNIVRYWSKIADLNLPHLYLAPPLVVIPLEFRRVFWHQKVLGLSYGVVSVILDA